jgi:hypothetical protein
MNLKSKENLEIAIWLIVGFVALVIGTGTTKSWPMALYAILVLVSIAIAIPLLIRLFKGNLHRTGKFTLAIVSFCLILLIVLGRMIRAFFQQIAH